MLNFVKKAFRGFFEVILWINLIVFTVGGGIVSYYLTYSSRGMFYSSHSGNPIPGIFIGLVVGLLSDIIFGGLVATFLNIDANIEKLLKGNLSLNTNENLVDKNNESEKCEPVIPLSNNQLKITRLKGVFGSAILVDIKLDDQTFQLENGGEKIFNVENGRHKITAFFNNENDKLEFDINNNSKVINVFIKPPIKIQEV